MPRLHRRTPTFGAIAYAESGTGPHALFLHGVFFSADLWAQQVAALSVLRHCVAIDLLAHGDSPCPPGRLTIGVQMEMVIEFLDSLGIEEVDLVGNDTGGAVAQMIAANHPERVRSLTLTDSDVHDNFPPEAFLPIQELATQGLMADGMAALATDPAGIRAALETSLERPGSVPDATLLGFFGVFTDPAKAGALQDYVAGMEPSELVALRDRLAAFVKPTLIVWATDDVFFPVRWAEWLEATVPGVTRSVRVKGGRLLFPLERPEELAQELRRFWDRTSAAVDGGGREGRSLPRPA